MKSVRMLGDLLGEEIVRAPCDLLRFVLLAQFCSRVEMGSAGTSVFTWVVYSGDSGSLDVAAGERLARIDL
jgi:hypothetical protein